MRPAEQQATQPPAPTPAAVPSTSLSKLTRPKPVMPPPPVPEIASAPRTSLKPATYVSIGSLKEQAADDPQRSEQERDAFRYQARQSYLKATQVDPKFAPAYVALAKSYFATGERDKCLAEFKKALAIAPNDASIWFEQGEVHARAKDWTGAIESMTRAVKLDPENKQYAKFLGLTLARSGRYDEGYAFLAQCMPEAEARTAVARMLEHNQQPDAAERQAKLALKADPDYAPARELVAGRGPQPAGGSAGPEAASPIRTARYDAPAQAPAQAPAAPRPAMATAAAKTAAPPRLPPVMLQSADGLAPAGPIRVGIDGIE
jgi:tetratricopeptide (TPR) repeat protein